MVVDPEPDPDDPDPDDPLPDVPEPEDPVPEPEELSLPEPLPEPLPDPLPDESDEVDGAEDEEDPALELDEPPERLSVL